ncbi:MAG TPA: YihY/virulence factor BrkB family protein [Clostridia bacterium]|nr:YihY/virulence factor BrkB family protein [Clostridia bacterium]
MAAESAWKLGGLTWKELGKRIWGEMNEDDVFGRSAALSYYFLLALFPMMLFLVSMLGMAAGPGTELRGNLMEYLGKVLPGSASGLVQQTVDQTAQNSGGGKLSFGILAALWSASAGITAIMSTLNVAYDLKESRPFWKVRGIALGLTIALSVLVISALTLVLYGGKIANFVGGLLHMGSAFSIAWFVVQWPLVLFALLAAFALVYYWAPNVKQQKWYWITPGAFIGVTLWLVASFGFKVYLNFFNNYSATYGSLGAVIILMLWFYVTGLSILVGGEINAEIEHAAAARGDQAARGRGQTASQSEEGSSPTRIEKRPAA